MKNNYKNITAIIALSVVLITACEKDVPPEDPVVKKPNEISLFIWNGLYDYYLWYDKVARLDPDTYASNDDFYKYLNSFGYDYEGLFYDLLYQYGTIDKWSWIVDDWEVLENSFAGISKTMGYDFRLVRYGSDDDLFGYIRYVVPGSPAEAAGLKRGDLFLEVDGQAITINNYMDLLINNESYALTLASISGSVISPTTTTDNMVAVELQENPIHYYDVFDVGGVKTGYLVYNAFTSNFDLQLNDVFTYFKNEGIGRLILDLRYNGGGSIQTAIYLASMIYSNNSEQVFSEAEWNDKLTSWIVSEFGADYLKYYFADTIAATSSTSEAVLTSLGLSDLYVITTSATASASELVINGLLPFMDVNLVGSNTTGKYVGSITVKDYDNQGNLVTDHKWALQPIVLKLTNSAGASDYVNGLPVDYQASEDFTSLLPFGDPDETLLKATIDYILGVKSARAQPALVEGIDYEVIADRKDFIPMAKEMYLEGDFRMQ